MSKISFIALLLMCIGYGLWSFIKPVELGYTFFYITTSIGIFFYTLYVRQSEKKKWETETDIKKIKCYYIWFLLSDFGMNLAGTKVFTEIFLRGTEWQPIEGWNFIYCAIVFLYRIIKKSPIKYP